MRVAIKILLFSIAAAVAAGCSSDDAGLQSDVSLPAPETEIDYEVTLEGAPSEDIAALLEDSLSIFRLSEGGAPSPAFLTRRLEADRDVVQTILKSEGYYTGEYAYEISSPVPEEGQTEPAEDAPWSAIVRVEPGPAFTLTSHELVFTQPAEMAPDLDAVKLGSPVGEVARAEGIVGAEANAVESLRNAGYPYAKGGGRRAIADLEAQTIEVVSQVEPGPFIRYGDLAIEGAESVDHDYLRTYKNWEDGGTLRQRNLDQYQRELAQTGLFSSVSVRLPEDPADVPADGVAPITVTAEERLPRTVTAGVRFNSDEGFAVRGSYQHRNLFGAGESVRTTLDISMVEPEILFDFRKPQYLRDEQDLISSASAGFRDDDVYTGFSSEFILGLERKLNRYWTVGAGGSVGFDNIEDDIEGVDTGKSFLLGVPTYAEFDDSNDVLNPTSGLRFRVAATPYSGTYDDEPVAFLVADGTASTYYDIVGDGRWIMAGRGRLGSILSGELETITPTKRLYSGGGGSVRGYQRDFIGPIDDDDSPTGGLSVIEVGAELRAPISGDIGGVAFFEGGSVSSELFPNFEEDMQWGDGAWFPLLFACRAGAVGYRLSNQRARRRQ